MSSTKRPAENLNASFEMMAKRQAVSNIYPTSFLIGTKKSGDVHSKILQIFMNYSIDISHFESRPNQGKDNESDFLFFVHTKLDSAKSATLLESVSNDLNEFAVSVLVLNDSPDTKDPKWFPRSIEELDHFADRVINLGDTLDVDHPGAKDKVYLERRKYFADIAINYKHVEPIPRIEYTEAEKSTWKVVYEKLSTLYPTHACEEFNTAFPLLEKNCGYSATNIPQLEDISRFLQRCTGFRLRPVAGLLSPRDFLSGLAFRVFHSTQYIRHPDKPMYTPEPDICHELLGHVPLFANKEFAEFSQEIGLASLGASDEDIDRLATCYWFTVEFGLCKQGDDLKAYGAGLLSSFGELSYCLSGKPELKPFKPEVTCKQEYDTTKYQPIYFIAESFSSAKDQMREFAATLKRPFHGRYNPYTQSIEVLESNHNLKELAHSIQSDVAILSAALARRAEGE